MSRIEECIVEPTKVNVGKTFKIRLKIHETKYNTYEDIRNLTYEDLRNMTYREVLVKEE